MDNLTLDQVQKAAPTKRRSSITQANVDSINKALANEETRREFRENILGYIGVLQDGRFKIEDYINAVKYVSFKLLGSSNIQAYTKTFPARYQRLVNSGVPDNHIAGHITAYNKNILVNKIMEQSLVPHHVLNNGMYQQALNVQVELMMFAKSETVRSNAADSILGHLKPPEAVDININMGTEDNDAVKQLEKSTLALVAQQKLMLQSGAMTVKQVAHSNIIPAKRGGDDDVIDVDVIQDNDNG